jgi:hypothetical protein
MSGENSKSSGEVGEKIVEKFFTRVGWNNSNANISFPCLFPEKHKNKKSQGNRTKHGIDAQFSYMSGLESNTLINVLASVKHTTGLYQKTLTTVPQGHIKDILDASKCYEFSPLNQEAKSLFQSETVKNYRIVPVLFYLASGDADDADFVSSISATRFFNDYEVEEFYLVDNKKMTFILDAIKYVKGEYPDYDVNFHYPSTSLNLMSVTQYTYGKTMPVENLASPFINFVFKKGERGDEVHKFVTVVQEPFAGDSLTQYLYAAKTHCASLASSYTIAFPDYYSAEHKSDVNKSIVQLSMPSESIKVASYSPDFRNLNDE